MTRLLHLLVWGAALLLYALGPYRFGRILALDFEALIVNLSQDYSPMQAAAWFASRDWIPAGKLLLWLGPLPATLLVGARVGYRLLRKPLAGANPLARLPGRVRALLLVLALAPLAAACFPFVLALSVWVSVEAYAWIQWYRNVDPAMTRMREIVPLAAMPGALILSWWGVSRAIRPGERTPWRERPGWRKAVTVGGVLVALPPLLALGAVGAVGLLHGSRVAAAPGRALFEQRCGGCHDLALSLYYIKTPAEWRRTVETQVKEEGVSLTPAEQDQVHAFLTGMRSFSDGWTFRTRCQRCHQSTSGWARRTRQDWVSIVERVARYSPYYYRPDVRGQLLSHLARTHTDDEGRLGLKGAEYDGFRRLGERCGSCHALSIEARRYSEATGEQLAALVRRMSGKMAHALTAAEQKEAARLYGRLARDPKLLSRLFPHHRPAEDRVIKW